MPSTQEEAIALLAPLLANPLTLVGGLFFLSLVTPLVEETAKSLPVWMAWRKLKSPAQGFALGALSGAGFGLMEGLFISTSPGDNLGRNPGRARRQQCDAHHHQRIVGLGHRNGRTQKRVLPALGRYLLGISIHGIWNACVVVMVYASGSHHPFRRKPEHRCRAYCDFAALFSRPAHPGRTDLPVGDQPPVAKVPARAAKIENTETPLVENMVR